MLSRFLLGFATALLIAGCSDDTNTQTASGTGGSSSSGSSSSGGDLTCNTGDGFQTFGESRDTSTVGIAADASGVYWVYEDGTLWHAEPGGISPEQLAKDLGPELHTLALDADHVYVVDYASAVYRVSKKGSAAEAPKQIYQGSAIGIAVDETSVYVTDGQGVSIIDKQSGGVQPFATIKAADSITLDATHVYVRTSGTADDLTARLYRIPKAGGAPSEIAPAEPLAYHYFAQELAVDASHVYWLNTSAGTISRTPLGGGTVETLASGIADPMSLILDDAFVYFTVRGKDGGSIEDRAVAKVPKGGGSIAFLAHGAQTSAFGIAVDDSRAYWTQRFIGGVVATACK